MNRKISFLFVLVFTIFSPASLFPAEEIKLISYYPAPFGAYKEIRVGPNDDFIRIFDNNSPTDYGTVIQPSDGALRVQGALNIFNENQAVITVGESQDNLIRYNVGGYGLQIGDSNADGPVTVEQAFGIKTAFANSAFTVNTYQLTDASSRINGIRVDHGLNTTSDIYGIMITGSNSGSGSFTAGYFWGDEYGIYAQGSKIAGNFYCSSLDTGTYGIKAKGGETGIYASGNKIAGDFVCMSYGPGYYGIRATGGLYAGYFDGDVKVTGDFSVDGTKNFLIDHPLKENLLLRHSCLEGPEAGIYQRGRVKLENREAILELPDYFKALCKDTLTLSLTPIGELALVSYVEIERGKRYKIFSDKDKIEVDWIIIGKRENITVEEEKNEK